MPAGKQEAGPETSCRLFQLELSHDPRNLIMVKNKLMAYLQVFRSIPLAVAMILILLNNEHIPGSSESHRSHLAQALILLQYFKIPHATDVCNSTSIIVENLDLSFKP